MAAAEPALEPAVFVRRGPVVQWWRSGGRPSDAKTGWEGLREIYLLPLFSVSELATQFQFEGAQTGRVNFNRKIHRLTHIGYHRKTPVVDLAFDAETYLLSEAVFTTREQNQSQVTYRYADYRRFGDLVLPARVSRQVGEAPPQVADAPAPGEALAPWVFTIEAVDFNPEFSPGDFSFREKGGAR